MRRMPSTASCGSRGDLECLRRHRCCRIAVSATSEAGRGRICNDTRVNILICVATAFERSLLSEPARRERSESSAPASAPSTRPMRRRSRFSQTARAIVVCGVGGAYPAPACRSATSPRAQIEIYGDLGAQSPAGFLDMKALGFPVVAAPTPLFQRTADAGVSDGRSCVGFVTVSTCTGTDAIGASRSKREPAARWRTWKVRRWRTSRICTACRSAKCAASATSSRIATPRRGGLKNAAAHTAVLQWIEPAASSAQDSP